MYRLKTCAKRRGQSIVELALLLPFFLLIIVGGIIDFGFAFYNLLALQQVANDAALYAAEHNASLTSVQSFILNHSSPPVNWKEASIYTAEISSFTYDVSASDTMRLRKVVLRYNSKTYTPFYQSVLNAAGGKPSLPLAAAATYKIPDTIVNED